MLNNENLVRNIKFYLVRSTSILNTITLQKLHLLLSLQRTFSNSATIQFVWPCANCNRSFWFFLDMRSFLLGVFQKYQHTEDVFWKWKQWFYFTQSPCCCWILWQRLHGFQGSVLKIRIIAWSSWILSFFGLSDLGEFNKFLVLSFLLIHLLVSCHPL